LEFNI